MRRPSVHHNAGCVLDGNQGGRSNGSADCRAGRPMIITEQLAQSDAFVAAWLPGTEGAGVADVLFGDFPFAGRLSYTWPRSMAQLPFDFANLGSGENGPLFAFGYGRDIPDPS